MNTLRWIAACAMVWLAVFVALCSGCAATLRPANLPDHERAAVNAAIAGWREAGLPSTDGCLLEYARVLHTTTATEFTRRCFPWKPEGAASCISQDVSKGFVGKAIPVIVLRPGLTVDANGEPIIHELDHKAYSCVYGGMGDPGHDSPRVWVAKGGEQSAQGRARALMRGPETPPSAP